MKKPTRFLAIIFMFSFFTSVHSNPLRNAKTVLYLSKFGYINKDSYDVPCAVEKEKLEDGIKAFQKFIGINETGDIKDAEEFINMYRCGTPDINLIKIDNDDSDGISIWKTKQITYSISSYPYYLSERAVKFEISRAFASWSEYIDIRFIFTDKVPDINIMFVDSLDTEYGSFNVKDKILGISNPANLMGEIYLNNKVLWTANYAVGANLYQAVVHQIGHILGLDHNGDHNSVLFPLEVDYDKYYNLSNGDITNIQKLYGAKKPINYDLLCENKKIDCVFNTGKNRFAYIFKDKYYWKMENDTLMSGYPKLISSKWKEINWPVHAAFQMENGLTYIFQNHQYWRYQGNVMDKKSPYTITTGFPNAPGVIKGAVLLDNILTLYSAQQIYQYTIKAEGIEYLGRRQTQNNFDTLFQFDGFSQNVIMVKGDTYGEILPKNLVVNKDYSYNYIGNGVNFNKKINSLFGCSNF